MKVLLTATFLPLFFQLTTSWLFEVETQGMVRNAGNGQYVRDLDRSNFGPDDLSNPEFLRSNKENPGRYNDNTILLSILKDQNFDGSIADLHQKAVSNRRRYDILRRTTS